MNWVTKQITEFIEDLIVSFITLLQDAIVAVFSMATDFAKLPLIENAIKATTLLVVPLIIIMVLKEIFNTHVLQTDGDPDSDPLQLLVKASKALCIACCNDIIYDFLNKLATNLMKDLNAAAKPEELFVSITDYFGTVAAMANPVVAPIMAIIITVYLILVMVLMLKAGIRGAELAFMKILLPIMVVDGITVASERWNNFTSSYGVTFFGFIPQMLAFSLSINFFVSGITGGKENLLYAIVCIWFSLNVPKWLEKFAYSSGLGKAGRGAMQSAMQLSLLKSRLA